MNIPHEKSAKPRYGSVSDTIVFGIMICLLAMLCAFPLFRAAAEEAEPEPLVITIQDRDYTILLSALFGRVERKVPESAETYIRNIDEYRVRIAHQVERNNTFITPLYTLTEDLPERLAEGYREEIDRINSRAKAQKVAVLPYVQNDAFLITAVTAEYNLYPSFVQALIERVHNRNLVRKLNKIREESSEIRSEIAVLYTKIKSVRSGR